MPVVLASRCSMRRFCLGRSGACARRCWLRVSFPVGVCAACPVAAAHACLMRRCFVSAALGVCAARLVVQSRRLLRRTPSTSATLQSQCWSITAPYSDPRELNFTARMHSEEPHACTFVHETHTRRLTTAQSRPTTSNARASHNMKPHQPTRPNAHRQ